MSENIVLVERDGPVAIVTMNRPDALNALSRALRAELVKTFADLHNVDWRAAGLEGFGKEADYIARQTHRWTKQYVASETKKISDMDALIEWLPKNIPPGDTTTIVHGDYRLDNMIRSFSNVFLVEKDLEKEPETIDIAQAITEVEDQLGELVRSSNTRISTDLSQASTVLFVPVLFRSILQNLITNSIKYSNTNREPRIFITTEDSDDYVIIHFEDNGIGINLEKHQKQLFKLFKRFSTETAEGMGVGLYMVKSIMDANDGQVNIDSTPGEGTRFDLFFRKEKELAL